MFIVHIIAELNQMQILGRKSVGCFRRKAIAIAHLYFLCVCVCAHSGTTKGKL